MESIKKVARKEARKEAREEGRKIFTRTYNSN